MIHRSPSPTEFERSLRSVLQETWSETFTIILCRLNTNRWIDCHIEEHINWISPIPSTVTASTTHQLIPDYDTVNSLTHPFSSPQRTTRLTTKHLLIRTWPENWRKWYPILYFPLPTTIPPPPCEHPLPAPGLNLEENDVACSSLLTNVLMFVSLIVGVGSEMIYSDCFLTIWENW